MRTRTLLAILIAAVSAGCASAPPKAPAAPAITVDQKMSWIFRLEDKRILRDPAPAPSPEPVVPAKRGKAAPPPAPVVVPDLTLLAADPEPRIRRRAALAIGRVGLPEGVAALLPRLTDDDPDVRQMAAFALGLLADKTAVPALTTALQDADPRVRGRAAEALGLIGDTGSAAAVGQMVSAYVKAGAIASMSPDQEAWPSTPEADAVRLGLFALVRQKGYEPLASAVLDDSGRVSGWWPVAYALRRINDPRAVPALRQLLATPGRYTRAFAARGLGAQKDAASVPQLIAMLEQAKGDVALTVSAIDALAQIGAPEGDAPILAVLTARETDPNVRLDAVAALATLKSQAALPYIQDLLTDEWPTMRAAAVHAAAAIDPAAFLTLLSGMEPDPHWVVRAAIADTLGRLAVPAAAERLRPMLEDRDKRVVPDVLDALTRLKAPGLDAILLAQIKEADIGVRAAAARGLGALRPAGSAVVLRDAYRQWLADQGSDAREAALTALARYGAAEAVETLRAALEDPDWSLRLKAASLLHGLDPSAETAMAIRPVPAAPVVPYDSPGARASRGTRRTSSSRPPGARLKSSWRFSTRRRRRRTSWRSPGAATSTACRFTASCRISSSRTGIRGETDRAVPGTRSATSSTSAPTSAARWGWRSRVPIPAAASSSSRTRHSRTSTRNTRPSATW